MFDRKVKLSAWILSAAIAFSTMTTPAMAAGILPSVGAGSSVTVAETSVTTASAKTENATVTAAKKNSALLGAGVESAAGGITIIEVKNIAPAKSEAPKKSVVEDDIAAPEPVKEIKTDNTDVVKTDVLAGASAGATLVQTVATTPVAESQTEDGSTVIEVPADMAEASVQTDTVSNQKLAGGVSGADAAVKSTTAEFKNLVIAKCNDYVNVRKEPNEEAEILGKLYNESVGDYVSEAEGGWVEIISGTVRGYVKAEYVVTGDAAVERAKEVVKRLAHVNTTTLYVRAEPTTDSSVVGMVPMDDDLSVLEEAEDGFVKVSVEEGEGFVSTEFVTLKNEFVKAESKEEEAARLAKEKAEREAALAAAQKKAGKKKGSSSSSGSGKSYAAPSGGNGAAVASYALQFVGNPYVYGGSSLTNGTDCSGFTMSVYSAFGVGLPHSSGAQRSCGTDVGGLANAQPGDIVCYSGHVGIYIGGGQIVHASTAKTGIKVSNASYRNVLSVRRIF